MRNAARIGVVIPARNEEQSIARVLDAIPEWADQVVVVDNGSTDGTARIAAERGARVVREPQPGYGAACLRGIAALDPCDVVAFLDADFSDYPDQMDRLVDPILNDQADLVIGSRRLGNAEPGALTPQQRFGNRLACTLIRWFWGVAFTDLGPFRAIRHASLLALDMQDRTYGWTVEMQVKAAGRGVRVCERPVDYRRRIGTSKISGTLRGVFGAGAKILKTIFAAAVRDFAQTRSSSPRRRLVVFTRYPEPGAAKTRMIPALGEEGAADLQRAMTEHTLETAAALPGVEVHIRYAGGDAERIQSWLGTGIHCTEQGTGDLGDRMRRAFETAFAEGVAQVVIIGTDCPDLSPAIVRSAFDALHRPGLVLGPALDGGYYLIGLHARGARRALDALFDDMPWGTERVYGETVRRASNAGVRVSRLVPLHDADRPEDLAIWNRHARGSTSPAVSVIVPALNEQQTLPATLAPLVNRPGIEVIVVDGGSTDNTRAVAENAGVRVLASARGRAVQMNTGAATASGKFLLFLHADTIVPDGFLNEIERVLANPRVSLGAFRFAVDDARLSMRVIACCTNLRARGLRLPYGDQGLFVRRDTFQALGGFPDLPVMEDFVFVRKAARAGRIRISRLSATTSARRWKRVGPWRAVLYNQLIVAGYALGLKPERLAALYRRPRGIP